MMADTVAIRVDSIFFDIAFWFLVGLSCVLSLVSTVQSATDAHVMLPEDSSQCAPDESIPSGRIASEEQVRVDPEDVPVSPPQTAAWRKNIRQNSKMNNLIAELKMKQRESQGR